MNRENIIELLKSIGIFLLAAAWAVLYIAQIIAFIKGLEICFDFGWILKTISVIVYLFIFRGAIGTFAMAIIGFYGAWKGWHWEWWQAALLCLPFIFLGVFAPILGRFEQLFFYFKYRKPRSPDS